ncbi:hypothetical protein T484DRAFT_2986277, partial [Baffinella frigidus]
MSQEGKIFIGGLNRSTTTESLRAHFEKFGLIADCVIMKDRNTQQPRGFGFVTFMSADVAEDVASRKQVIVDGRSVEVKRAVPRGDEEVVRKKSSPTASPTGSLSPQQSASSPMKSPPSVHTANKIFVGGIAWSTADDEFHRFFERYGAVASAHVMKYRDGTPRGFGYVTFVDEASVDKAVSSRNSIGGRDVDVKRAMSKEEMDSGKEGSPQWFQRWGASQP